MKIGIVTFHSALNAGAILQAYALQTRLEQMGHQAEFIDYVPKHKYSWREFVAKSPKVMFRKWIDNYNGWRYRKYTDWNRCLKKSSIRYHSYNELKRNPPKYDTYIVGSDQVWNFLIELSPIHLLEFVPEGKRRIAYAASMGQCNVPQNLRSELRNKLKKFHAISLREDNGVDFINKLLGKQTALKTIDPTLLIPKEYYNKISIQPAIRQKFIASYILSMLDKQQIENLRHWAKLKNLSFINLRNPDTCIHFPKVINTIVTPYQWVGYIQHAEIVICGSFHATVFALIYHKPFLVILPKSLEEKGGNARINSLLQPLGLQYRIIYDNTINRMNKIIEHDIDWGKIDSILIKQKNESKQFLKATLS